MPLMLPRLTYDLHRRSDFRYGFAILVVAAASLCQWLFAAESQLFPFLFFYPAVFLVSIAGGARAGFFAIFISLFAAFYLYYPQLREESLLGLAVYTITGSLSVWLTGRFHHLLLDSQRANRYLKIISDSVPALIAYIDNTYRYCFVNSEYETWFGAPANSLIGCHVEDIIGKKYFKERQHYMDRALRGEEVIFESFLVHRKRGTVPVNLTYAPDIDERGHVRGFGVLAQDISELKQSQENLRLANEAAKSASRAKSLFLANMSHEIRTPVSAILGFARLLVKGEPTIDEAVKYSQIIEKNGKHLLRLIDDILNVSKVEAGKIDLQLSRCPLMEILKECDEIIRPQAVAKGLLLEFIPASPVPPEIETDPVRLKQILTNIISNAVKFTNKGKITVKIFAEKKADQKPESWRLCFDIEDTGPGIRESEKLALFQPFSQADPSTNRKVGGTGLGLYLSQCLAKGLGGDVLILRSTLGYGSTFRVEIDPGPLDSSKFVADLSFHEKLDLKAQESVSRPLTGLRILSIEDSEDNQFLIAKILKLAGASVELAADGGAGISKALHESFDAILMDIQMPDIDGYMATRFLRKQGHRGPIIALTAHAMSEEKDRCLRAGCNECLSKPIDSAKLIATIRRLAGLSLSVGENLGYQA